MDFKKLFSFGRKEEKGGIHAVTFSDFGWKKRQETAYEISWEHPSYPAILSVNYIDVSPDISYDSPVESLRDLYRWMAGMRETGIIKVDAAEIGNIRYIETIMKHPRAEGGVQYIGALTIPFDDESYVIRVQAIEKGDTGFREATIASQLLASGLISIDANGVTIGWNADPYDPNLSEGFLMNRSEDEQYDVQFPEHPLTIIRTKLRELVGSLRFAEGLKQ